MNSLSTQVLRLSQQLATIDLIAVGWSKIDFFVFLERASFEKDLTLIDCLHLSKSLRSEKLKMSSVFISTFDLSFCDFSAISLMLYPSYLFYDSMLHGICFHLKHERLAPKYWISFKENDSLLVHVALALANELPHYIWESQLYLLNSFVLVRCHSCPDLNSRCFLWYYFPFHGIVLLNDYLLYYAEKFNRLDDETFIIFK